MIISDFFGYEIPPLRSQHFSCPVTVFCDLFGKVFGIFEFALVADALNEIHSHILADQIVNTFNKQMCFYQQWKIIAVSSCLADTVNRWDFFFGFKGIVHEFTDFDKTGIDPLGGNDLLGRTEAAEFRSKLDTLVSSLRADEHEVLLLELPLFPLQNAYGKAQRDMVRKYGLAMLPKRCFAKVLGTENGTLDGLHLSQAGHDAMAMIIASVLK